MANQDLHNTYVERDRVVTREGNGAGAFIIGGIVVALLVLVWLFSMGGDSAVTTVPADGTTNNVTIENTAPADTTAPVAVTPDAGTGSTTTAPAPQAAPADTAEPTTPAAPAAPAGN